MNKNIIIVLVVIGVLVLGNYFYAEGERKKVVEIPKEDTSISFFVTSLNPGTGGDLGGLTGADAYCTQLAEKAGVTGKTWNAYLSTTGQGGVNARDRIGSGPWYNAKGELVAQDIETLHGENGLNKTTALTETGSIIMGRGDETNMHDILTGSLADGRASTTATTATTDTTCANWTSSGAGSAIVGHHDRIGINDSAPMKSWNSSHATRGCDMTSFKATGGAGLFYCFAQ